MFRAVHFPLILEQGNKDFYVMIWQNAKSLSENLDDIFLGESRKVILDLFIALGILASFLIWLLIYLILIDTLKVDQKSNRNKEGKSKSSIRGYQYIEKKEMGKRK